MIAVHDETREKADIVSDPHAQSPQLADSGRIQDTALSQVTEDLLLSMEPVKQERKRLSGLSFQIVVTP